MVDASALFTKFINIIVKEMDLFSCEMFFRIFELRAAVYECNLR